MTAFPVAVPNVVRTKAIAVGASRWLDELPATIADLESAWGFTTGAAYPDATEAFVAPVVRDDGSPAVLKLLVPQVGGFADREMEVLRLAGGVGCVALLASDRTRHALLLERLGPSLSELGRPLDERLTILCAVARRLWRPAPDAALPTGAAAARRMTASIERLWADLDRPCSARAVDHALECAARRAAAHDDERAVLVHGDIHQWNTLRAGNEFKLVDPDGYLAEPAFDLGVLMREDPEPLLTGDPSERSRLLAARTGLDDAAIWEWGVVQRVWNGLLCLRDGLTPYAVDALAVADRVAGQ